LWKLYDIVTVEIIVFTSIHLQSVWSYLNVNCIGTFLNHCNIKTMKVGIELFFSPKFTCQFWISMGWWDKPHFVPTFLLIFYTLSTHYVPSSTPFSTQVVVLFFKGPLLFHFVAAFTMDEIIVLLHYKI